MPLAVNLIRLIVSLIMILFGINQLVNPNKWIKEYFPKFLKENKFTSPTLTMRFHACLNILLGLVFFFGVFGKIGDFITLFWWISVLPFVIMHDWRIAVRDIAIIVSIIVVILL